jgi:hypothetical protein
LIPKVFVSVSKKRRKGPSRKGIQSENNQDEAEIQLLYYSSDDRRGLLLALLLKVSPC